MNFSVTQQWNGTPVDHEPVTLTLQPGGGGVKMVVKAPFFDDPPNPGGVPGKPFPQLWDYEGIDYRYRFVKIKNQIPLLFASSISRTICLHFVLNSCF